MSAPAAVAPAGVGAGPGPPPTTLELAVNFTLYQAGWMACVLGAAHGLAGAGAAAGAALVAAHLALARHPRGELALAALAALLGLAADSAQIALGIFRFPAGQLATWLSPPFMVVLWAQFATTFQFSLRWLVGRPVVAAAAGLAGGPLAFWVGSRLGAIDMLAPAWRSYGSVAVVWAAAVPLLSWAAARLRPAASPLYRLPRGRSR